MSSVLDLQEALLEMPQIEIPTTHRFCNGIYSRQIEIPAGACLVGARHKTDFFLTISSGKCTIVDGEVSTVLSAPITIISKAGAKRSIYAHEDTVMTTFHATKETDVAIIEKSIIEPEGLMVANNPKELLVCPG